MATSKPAIIRVGDEYQAQVPDFDEEVKKAIVDNLEHFTEKETQMLGVRFWPPNIDRITIIILAHRQGKVRESVRRVANPWRKRKIRRSAWH